MMFTLFLIIVRVVQPWKYHLTSIRMKDGEIGVICGTQQQIDRFDKILEEKRKTHIGHLIAEYEQQKIYELKHGG